KPAARLGPMGGFFNANPPPRPATAVNPDMRPSSAFQLNPELRSSSASTVPQLPSQGGRQSPYPPSTYNTAHNSRPMIPMQVQQASYGPGPGMRPTAGRIASGPAGMQNYGGPTGPRPGPTPGPPTLQPGKLAHAPTAPPAQPPQRLDIGFSAPAEARGHRYGPPSVGGKPASPTAAGRSGSMPNFDHPASLPPTAGVGGGGRISRPGSRPPQESRTPVLPSGGGGGGGAPRLPIKDRDSTPAPSSLPSTTPKPKPNQAPTQARPIPPGKGPKTFDEMGVPAQTKDSECVIM
ncbi:hypothetical protein B0A55_13654, partial [Friedmanniomyces simplex]